VDRSPCGEGTAASGRHRTVIGDRRDLLCARGGRPGTARPRGRTRRRAPPRSYRRGVFFLDVRRPLPAEAGMPPTPARRPRTTRRPTGGTSARTTSSVQPPGSPEAAPCPGRSRAPRRARRALVVDAAPLVGREGAAPKSRPPRAGPTGTVRFCAVARDRTRGERASKGSVGSPCGEGTAASGRRAPAVGDRARVSDARRRPPGEARPRGRTSRLAPPGSPRSVATNAGRPLPLEGSRRTPAARRRANHGDAGGWWEGWNPVFCSNRSYTHRSACEHPVPCQPTREAGVRPGRRSNCRERAPLRKAARRMRGPSRSSDSAPWLYNIARGAGARRVVECVACGDGTAASGRHGIATGDRIKGRSRVSNSRKNPPRALVLRAGPRPNRCGGARHRRPAPVAPRSHSVHDHGPPTFEPREGRRRRGWHGHAGPRGPTRQRRREPAQRGATARRFYPERAPNSGEVGAAPWRGFEPAEGWKRRFHLDAGDRIGWERRAVHRHAKRPGPAPRARRPAPPSTRSKRSSKRRGARGFRPFTSLDHVFRPHPRMPQNAKTISDVGRGPPRVFARASWPPVRRLRRSPCGRASSPDPRPVFGPKPNIGQFSEGRPFEAAVSTERSAASGCRPRRAGDVDTRGGVGRAVRAERGR
jgi:hypothetical protein